MKEFILLFSKVEFQIIISFIVSVVITITAIPVIINISKLKDLMAEIEIRSSHEQLTPTLGGVAIFAATLISYFLWKIPSEGNEMHLAVSSLIILFFLGIKDDILILSPKKKLLIQIAASLLLITLGDLRISNLYGLLGYNSISYLPGIILTTFIFIVLTNAVNLIDGIDGLAGSFGLLSSICFAVLFYKLNLFAYVILSVSLGGSLLGFLRYNFSIKNKIFMGDTGSLILGFLISFFSIKYITTNSSYAYDSNLENDAPLLVMVILILPLFDTLRMFFIRILSGKSPFKGDRNHFHHILLDRNLSHWNATIILLAFNLLAIYVYNEFSFLFSNNINFVFYLITFSLYCIVAYFLSKNNTHINGVNSQYTNINKLKRLELAEGKKANLNNQNN
jgi:UDP-N-acetylmuramyl pentapeptide phosphotransferase/UDP-N-acetylglucosamine-1-phosphate transferase